MEQSPSEVVINYRPHPGQARFHQSRARIRVLVCGRRWGKDRSSVNETIMRALELYEGRKAQPQQTLIPLVHVWVVAPIIELTRQNWLEFNTFIPKQLISRSNESLRILELMNGAIRIEFKSADNPKTLVSVGLDILLITEAGIINEQAWEESLQPTLSSPGRAGLAIINGTPKGAGSWFHSLYLRGLDPQDTEVDSWGTPEQGMSSYDNPYQDKRRLDGMASSMPRRLYEQEILAKWLDDAGGVFRGVDACAVGSLQAPKPGKLYVVGADLAKYHDWTVLTVMDAETAEVVGWERFNQVDWPVQKRRIIHLARTYHNARVIIDSTGHDSIVDDLREVGVAVEGYHFTAPSKKNLVNNLIVGIEQQKLTFPPIQVIINELKIYEYRATKAGNLQMGAPEGEDYFDDCVISLALAYWLVARLGGESVEIAEVGIGIASTGQLLEDSFALAKRMFRSVNDARELLRRQEEAEAEVEDGAFTIAVASVPGMELTPRPWYDTLLDTTRRQIADRRAALAAHTVEE